MCLCPLSKSNKLFPPQRNDWSIYFLDISLKETFVKKIHSFSDNVPETENVKSFALQHGDIEESYNNAAEDAGVAHDADGGGQGGCPYLHPRHHGGPRILLPS